MADKIDAIENLHRRISTFETKHLDHEINELREMLHTMTEQEANTSKLLVQEKHRAERQTIDKQEAMRELEAVRKELKREIEESLASKEMVIQMLTNDNANLKQQKAKIRCDYLRANNELVAVRRELEFLKRSYADAEKTETQLRDEMAIEKTLRKQALDDIEKIKESERAKMAEQVAADTKREMDKLHELYEKECEKSKALKSFICDQEKQCDDLAGHIKTLTKDRDLWMDRAEKRANELQDLRQKIVNAESKVGETTRLREELNRYKDKSSFLERQIKTLHVEYRQELGDLTKKLAAAHDPSENGTVTRTKTNMLAQKFESRSQAPQPSQPSRPTTSTFADSRAKQLESELKTERNILIEKELEIKNLQAQIDEMEESESQLADDRTRALTALNEAVEKLEIKSDKLEKLQSVQDEMSQELQRAYDQIADLEDRLRDIENKLRKKDEDITYWRRMYERRNAPYSETDSQSEAQSEVVDRFQFEFYDDEDDEENRSPKKKVRYEDEALIRPTITEAPNTPRLGMMRHEIAHRFRNVWMLLKQKAVACARCGEILPTLKTAAKCQDCHLYAHLSCARRIGKTCGLPADYAQFYIDTIDSHRRQEREAQQTDNFN